MKKTLLLIIAVSVTISAMAGNVSESVATRLAESLFGTTRGGSVSLVWNGRDKNTRGVSEPAFYVFNNDGGGFVVISAEDRAYPILGYSNTGSFVVENMPSNIRAFFEGYAKEIDYLRSSSIVQSSEIAARWKNLSTPTLQKDLETAKWGQYTPFNDKCPKVDGQQSVAGCVATATSIVMYYHKWPKSQSGSLESYSYKTDKGNVRKQDGHDLAAAYDWDAMKSSYQSSSTKASKEAVATLFFDVGVMLKSEYNSADGEQTFGTGAYSYDIAPMLIKYMSYDSSAVLKIRESMSSAKWHSLMKDEVDAKRPVLYSGSGNNGGHQFVLDGYGTDDFFHINWGWSGLDNGLFRLEALVDSDNNDFNICQSAVVSLMPFSGGKPAEQLNYFFNNIDGTGGLILLSGTPAKGNSLVVEAQNCFNSNCGTFEGSEVGSLTFYSALCLCDKDDNIKEFLVKYLNPFILDAGYAYSDTLTCKITKDVELGDKIRYMYKTTGDWTPVEIDYSYYNFVYETHLYNISDAIAVYDYPEIKVDPNGYYVGDMLDLRVTNCRYIPTIVWYFDGVKLDNGINQVRLSKAGKHTIKAEISCYKKTSKSSNNSAVYSSTLVRVINVE